MNANSPGKSGPALRIVVRLLIVLVILIVAFAFVVWRAPLWVAGEVTRVQLSRAGIHSGGMRGDGYQTHYSEGASGQPFGLIHGRAPEAQQDWFNRAPRLVRAGYH